MWVNGEPVALNSPSSTPSSEFHTPMSPTASGYDPRESWYLPVKRTWNPGDLLEIEFEMALNIRATHHKVKSTLGQVAVSYGPLVYCLESVDNPDVNIFAVQLDPGSLYTKTDSELFGGTTIIHGQTADGKPLTFIPYYLWANRGESMMTVYVRT